jgi:hypothetical protein
VQLAAGLREIARALGGEISGGEVLAPGPGHSAKDRSLSIKPSGDGKFLVHSFAYDDPMVCRIMCARVLACRPSSQTAK